MEDGLPSNSVNDAYKDSRGYLWLATDNGISRYDGYYFNNFTGKSNLPSNIVKCIFEDSNGRIWFGTLNGLAYYDYADGKVYSHVPDFDSNIVVANMEVFDISEDHEGNIWYINGSIVKLNFKTCKDTMYSSANKWKNLKSGQFVHLISNNNTGHLNGPTRVVFKQGDLNPYCATWRGGIVKVNLKKKRIEQVLPNSRNGEIVRYNGIEFIGDYMITSSMGEGLEIYKNKKLKVIVNKENKLLTRNMVNDFFLDIENMALWVATDIGLNKIRFNDGFIIDTAQSVSDLSGKRINTVDFVGNNMVLAGSESGISFLTDNFNRIYKFKLSDKPCSIKNNNVTSFYKKENGNIMIGTWGGGVNIFNKEEMCFYNFTENSSIDKYISVIKGVSDRGIILLGSRNSGVYIYNTLNGKIFQPDFWKNEKLKSGFRFINKIIVKDNYAWVITKMGLVKLNLVDFKSIVVKEKVEQQNKSLGSQLNDIEVCDNEDILLGNFKGLQVIDKNSLLLKDSLQICDNSKKYSILSFNKVISEIFLDSYNYFWLLYDDKVVKLGEDYKILNIFKINKPFCITEVERRIFIGSRDGLLRIDIDSNKGDSGSVEKIIKDYEIFEVLVQKDNLWLATNDGLILYNDDDESFITLNYDDGLVKNSFRSADLFVAGSEEIMIGTEDGINLIKGINKSINNYSELFFTELYFDESVIIPGQKYYKKTVLEKPLRKASQIVVPNGVRKIKILFSDFNYDKVINNGFYCRLLNYDDTFYKSSDNFVVYENLPSGKYFLTVKRIGSIAEKEIIIKVLPPFYKMWWFYIFVLFVSIITVLLIVKIRTASVIKRNQKLEENVKRRTQEIKAQSRELLSKNEMIEKQNQDLEELNNTKDKLFSIIAHDLKNPFNQISGFLSLLLNNYNTYDDDKKIELLDFVKKSVRKTQEMLENLLSWSRSSLNKVSFEPSEVELDKIIDEAILFFGPFMNEKKIKAEFYRSNLKVYADFNILLIVFRNLLSNAIKYSNIGGKLEIFITQSTENIYISFKDYGVGMSQDVVNDITNEAKLKSLRGTDNEEGTGLGLLICKDLIKKHNGYLNIISEPGKGSEFIVTIPF